MKALTREQVERRKAQRSASLAMCAKITSWPTRSRMSLSKSTPKGVTSNSAIREEQHQCQCKHGVNWEAEIGRRQPADEPRMAAIMAGSLDEPLRAERDAQDRSQKLTEEALRSLPWDATEAEKARATAAIRGALQQFGGSARACTEIRVAAQGAVDPLRRAVERRKLEARLSAWAACELPGVAAIETRPGYGGSAPRFWPSYRSTSQRPKARKRWSVPPAKRARKLKSGRQNTSGKPAKSGWFNRELPTFPPTCTN